MHFFPNRSALVLCMVTLTTGVVAAQVPVGSQTTEMYALAAPDTPLADEPSPTGTAPELSAFSVMKLSGRLVGADGAPLTGTTGVTFSFYSEQAGGTPLWIETQTVTLDEDGRYTVLMGSQSATGLPMEMFSTGEARWLGVETLSGPEQQRILLVSVPYAMKAAEADRLGGRAADEFVLNETLETAVRNELRTQIALDAGLTTDTSGTVKSLTGSGTAGQIAKWGTATSLGPSAITADGTGRIGIGTTTPTARLEVAGMVKATTYVGDGTNLGGIPTLAGNNQFVASQNFFNGSGGAVVVPILIAQGTFDEDGSHSKGLLTVRNSGTGAGLLVRSQNRAIQGVSLATTGTPFGLSGTTAADGGIGIYGLASAPVGTAIGLYGLSWADGGYGIVGKALSTTGVNAGILGVSMSTDGTAMLARARHATGNTTGLRIEVQSPNGALVSALGAGTELFGVDGAGNVRANAFFDLLGNPVGGAALGDITAVITDPGSGLSGGAPTGDATLTLDSTCIAGQILTSSGGGVWACAADADSGTVTEITAGLGLSGGIINTIGTIAVDPTRVQNRVDGTCAVGNAIREIFQDGSTVTCEPIGGGTGTVTSIGVGPGLSVVAPGTSPITISGDIELNTTFTDGLYAQIAASNTFSTGTQLIQTIGSPGLVGLAVQGDVAQTANLQEWRDSTTAVVASVDASGVFTGDGSGLINLPGGGDITAVIAPANSGIEGGALTGDATLRLLTTCAAGDVLQSSGGADTWACAAAGGGGDITEVIGGTGITITGDGTTGPATVNIDTAVVPQMNAANTFTAGTQLIQTIGTPAVVGLAVQADVSQTAFMQEWRNSAGTAISWVDQNGILSGNGSGLTGLPGGGDITGIITGGTSGLSGGALTGDATLTLDSTCIAGQILTSSGSGVWACTADADSGGTVTSITVGAGLTPLGAITGSGSIAVDTTTIQARVSNSCTAGNFYSAVAANGTATCSAELGDITGVVAGTGLTGGATTGSATLSMLTSCAADEVLAWDGVSAWACAGVPQLTVTNTFTTGQIITTTGVSALDATSSNTAAITLLGTASDTTGAAVGVYGDSAAASGSGVYGRSAGLFGAGGTFENTAGGPVIVGIDLFGGTVFQVTAGGNVTTTGQFSGSGAGLSAVPVGSLLGTVSIANGGTAATNAAQARVNLSAAAASHTHDTLYVQLIGGTMTGGLVSSVASTADAVTASAGYINLALTTGSPVATDCDAAAEYGRMKVDAGSGTETLWVCTSTGWKSTALI